MELDKTVAEAGENRKAEHEDFQARQKRKGEEKSGPDFYCWSMMRDYFVEICPYILTHVMLYYGELGGDRSHSFSLSLSLSLPLLPALYCRVVV